MIPLTHIMERGAIPVGKKEKKKNVGKGSVE
jgi:hypothetical protein